MQKRLLLALVAVVLIAGMFISGCGTPAAIPAPTTPAATTPAATTPAATTPAAATYKWRLEAFYPPPDDRLVKGLGEFARRIKDATNGQVEITLFPSGALVPAPQIFKSVADGTLEMGCTTPSYHAGIMSFAPVPDGLPMSWRNPGDLTKVMWEKGLQSLMREEYAKQGVYFLTWQCGGPVTIISKKPLRTQADFQGTKIRGYGLYNTFISKLGASAVDMPLVEAYTGLSMGTIDAATTGPGGHVSLKLYEIAKYLMTPYPGGEVMHDITLSLKTWNALPDNLKNSIQAAATDFTKWSTTEFTTTYDKGYYIDTMTKAGVQLVVVEPATLEWMQGKAMEQWADIAAKDATAAKAVKIMTDYLKEAGAIK